MRYLQVETVVAALDIAPQELSKKLIGMASDGASVMVGLQNGVAAKLRSDIAPRLINTHCYAHCVQVCSQLMRGHYYTTY